VRGGALLLLLLVKRPMTTIHLERQTDWDSDGAKGELCERRIWVVCGAVSSGDGSVNSGSAYAFTRPDVTAWLHASRSSTFDVADGGAPYLPSGIVVLAMAGAALVTLRRRVVRLVRIGPELRVESGGRASSVLLREVRTVDIESAAVNRHGITLALVDGRRVAVGAPSLRMTDALLVRGNVRAALDFAINSRR
jgi:hypothetical protein